MKIFPAAFVKEIDAYTIKNEPIESIDLMERAASKLTGWYVRHFKTDRRAVIFAGPGNNGGDALALGRMLAERQYTVLCYMVNPKNKLSNDNQHNLKRLREQGLAHVENLVDGNPLPGLRKGDVVIDGIFGSGLTRPAEGFFARVIRHINREAFTIVSIDIPSGLFGEDNSGNEPDSIVRAHFTPTFQFPFLSFFFAENEVYTGRWRVLDIGLHRSFIQQSECRYQYLQRQDIARLLPQQQKHDHKGTNGHALVIAGSHGMMGAAVLTAKSAMRTGAGLVTAHVPAEEINIIQTTVPEAIVSLDPTDQQFTHPPELETYQSIAAGPGLRQAPETREGLRKLLKAASVPLVLDADALNLMASEPSLLNELPENTILTPHPGEFDRLAGKSADGWSRHLAQLEFSEKHRVITLLKGAYTGIALPDGRYFFNLTGNPGMATGGSGDVLTGIIVSLLARGLGPEDAAIAGAFIHGYAGDIAANEVGQDAMVAGDIVSHIGQAFLRIRERPFLNEERRGGLV